jgi:hypothetical protein
VYTTLRPNDRRSADQRDQYKSICIDVLHELFVDEEALDCMSVSHRLKDSTASLDVCDGALGV